MALIDPLSLTVCRHSPALCMWGGDMYMYAVYVGGDMYMYAVRAYPKLVLNFQYSCLNLASTGVTGLYHIPS